MPAKSNISLTITYEIDIQNQFLGSLCYELEMMATFGLTPLFRPVCITKCPNSKVQFGKVGKLVCGPCLVFVNLFYFFGLVFIVEWEIDNH